MGNFHILRPWGLILIVLPILLANQNCAGPQESPCTGDSCVNSRLTTDPEDESEDAPVPPDLGSESEEEPLPSACVFNNSPVAHGSFVWAFSQSTATNCSAISQQRICDDGVLSGSYPYAACSTNPQNKSCLFNGVTVTHLGTTTAYRSSTVPIGSVCESETRGCTNGSLSGSFSQSSCVIQSVVTNSTELKQALAAAKGGETIYVKASSQKYDVQVSNLKPTSKVLITAFDKSNRPVFETLKFYASQNLHFDSLKFDSIGSTRADWLNDIHIENSSSITISNSKMINIATQYRTVTSVLGDNGVLVSGVQGFQFLNNEVSNYNFAVTVFKSKNLVFTKNNFHHMQGDGIIFGDAQNVLIEENSFHDFLGSKHALNHTDLIQFYTSDISFQSRDITIRKNTFINGGGSWSQVIFMGNELVRSGKGGRELYYKNVLIEENLVHNNTWHGITVYYPDGLIIRKNAVFLHKNALNWEDTNNAIYIQVAGTDPYNAVVEKNIAQRYSLAAGTQSSGNITINYTSTSDAYYVKKHFADPLAESAATISSFKILSGSSLAPLGVGPAIIQPTP